MFSFHSHLNIMECKVYCPDMITSELRDVKRKSKHHPDCFALTWRMHHYACSWIPLCHVKQKLDAAFAFI